MKKDKPIPKAVALYYYPEYNNVAYLQNHFSNEESLDVLYNTNVFQVEIGLFQMN